MPVRLSDYTTLFLDRDGVLNRRLIADYVKRPEEFEWLPGVLPALQVLRPRFSRVVVVTNQQGVGKGLMTDVDLAAVHRRMRGQAAAVGVNFDAVYACTSLAADQDPRRKPGPGMGHEAQAEFPEIDFRQSIMVGDSPSDMAFGEGLGMACVGIGDRVAVAERYDSLWDWVEATTPPSGGRPL